MSTTGTMIAPEHQMLGEVEMVGRDRWEEIHRRAGDGRFDSGDCSRDGATASQGVCAIARDSEKTPSWTESCIW